MSGIRERSNSDGHVVKIYDDDRDLARGVSAYLAAGLRAGDVVIVVTTPAHRQAFEQALEALVDLPERTADGTYLPVDAKTLLAEFMVGGAPDPARFSSALGDLLATANGRSVRIFGEMVSVLWDEGNITAAIALESFWNDLATRHDFSLYCAYAMASFESASDLASLRERLRAPHRHRRSGELRVERAGCGRHRGRDHDLRVLRAGTGGHPLRPPVRAVDVAGLGRDRAARGRRMWSSPSWPPTRCATPVHRSAFRSRAERDTIKLMVHDGSDEAAEARPLTIDAEGGRGLSLVAALCPTWGTERVADGKIVWAELASRDLNAADRAGSAVGQQLVEALVALDDAGLHAAGHEGVAVLEAVDERRGRRGGCARRRGPRTRCVSSATPSGTPSKVKVCTMSSPARTSWNEP